MDMLAYGSYYGLSAMYSLSGPSTLVFQAVASLGPAAAVLFPALGGLLRYWLTRRFPGRGVAIAVVLLSLFMQFYFMPLYGEWLREHLEDDTTTYDHDRFCFRLKPVSVAFMQTCVETGIKLSTWPLVRAHNTVVQQVGQLVYGYATHPLTTLGIAAAVAALVVWAQSKVAPAIESARLARAHADRSAVLQKLATGAASMAPPPGRGL